jgi:excisionase family DNA binding protein
MKTLTLEQAAEILQLTPRTVYNHLRAGKIPGRKVVGRWRILESDLIEYMQRQEAPEKGEQD